MERIGRYRLVARIGAGSFATVWQGHDDDLDVPVAIKVLAENWSAREDVRGRFVSEARLMRRISDNRIIRVYDIGELDDGRPYFVMDYCDAGSLDQWRRELRAPAQAIRAAAEACRALQVLHDHRVVHRDVTPGNLLLDTRADGSLVIRLSDLGVAKSMVDDVGGTMTAGTPSYMALEQATGAGFDHRADIYAIGCVTYALLTGRPPFRVRNLADLLNRTADQHPEPIAERLGIPTDLDDVLRHALARDASARPASAKALADRLDRIAGQIEADGAEPSTTAVDLTRVRRVTAPPAWPTLPERPAEGAPSHSAPSPGSLPPASRQRVSWSEQSAARQRQSWSERPAAQPTRTPQPPAAPTQAPHPQGGQPAPPIQNVPTHGQMVNDWSYLPAARPAAEPNRRRGGALMWLLLAIGAFLLALLLGWIYFSLT